MTALTTKGLLEIIDGKDKQIKELKETLKWMTEGLEEFMITANPYVEGEIKKAKKLYEEPEVTTFTGKKTVRAQDGDYGMILDADGNKVNSKWAQANLETGLVREYETVSKLVDKIYKKPLRFIPVSDPEYVELMSQPKPTNNRK